MKLRRTANAGVLLELDGARILLDGVCREVKPYPATPPRIRAELTESFPDAIAFTHAHKDHYDPTYAALYQKQTGGVVLGPRECHGTMEPVTAGGVRITPLPSRHIGAAGRTTPHASFLLEGSCCVWFTGDAAPVCWRGKTDLPRPNVLVVPYAYATTPAAWTLTQSLGAARVVMLHLPQREQDPLGLWSAIEQTAGVQSGILFPKMGETLIIG